MRKDLKDASNFKAIFNLLKILWKWAKRITIVLLILLVLALIAIRSPYVQSKLVAFIGERLGDSLGTQVEVGRVDLEFFRSLVLEDLLVYDQAGDTLLFLDKLACSVDRLQPKKGIYSFRDLELHGVLFDLKVKAGEDVTNMQFILDKIATEEKDSSKVDLLFRSDKIAIVDLNFRYLNENGRDSSSGIDFNDIDVRNFNLKALDISYYQDTIKADINKLALAEKSGFLLQELNGGTYVSSKGLAVHNAHISTGKSKVHGDIVFEYENYSAFSDFVDGVYMKCSFDSTSVNSMDLAYFAKDLNGADIMVDISGKVRGTVSDLKARKFHLHYGAHTEFSGNLDLSGLPNIEETFMIIDVQHLETTFADLEGINLPPFHSKKTLTLPTNISRVGKMDFHGNFTGFINDMVAYGTLTTDIGRIRTDMSFVRDTVEGNFIYNGRFIAEGFDIGKFYANKNLGQLSCDLQVDAQGSSLNTLRADMNGTVDQLQFNKYNISSIVVNGQFEKEHFTGELECSDPNLMFIFSGEADFTSKVPSLEFDANIFHADLNELGVIEDHGFSSLTTRIGIDALLDPNDPSGTLSLKDLSYCTDMGQFDMGNIYFDTEPHETGKQFSVNSGILNATVTGVYNAQQIGGALKSILFSAFPALAGQVEYEQVDQVFSLEIEMGQSDRLMELVLPELRIAPGSKLTASIDTRTFNIGLDAGSSTVLWKGRKIAGLEVALHQTMEVFGGSIKANRLELGDSLYVDDLLITAKGFQDEFDIMIDWRGSGLGANGRLEFQGGVNGPQQVDIDILPSYFNIHDQHWSTNKTSMVTIDSTEVQISGLELFNGDQRIQLQGAISKDPKKSLKMDFSAFDLSSFNVLLQNAGISIKGILEGEASVSDVYGIPLLLSYMCVDSLGLNEKDLGFLTLAVVWENEDQLIDIFGTLENDNINALDISGYFKPDGDNSYIELNAEVNGLDLVFLNAIIPDNLTDMKGRATGNLKYAGPVARPELTGQLFLEKAGLRVAELNTFYTFDHEIKFYPGSFIFDFMEVHDDLYRKGKEGHKGIISGAINHTGFKDWNFDIFGEMHNLLAVNTTSSMSDLYYGTAFVTGDVNVFGYTDNLEITVNARSEKGTNIALPLASSTEVSMSDFIRFIDVDSTFTEHTEEGIDLTGISMELNLELTPDADLELIFDETVGDVIRGNGSGNISMEIDPNGEFSMNGDYNINEGDYLFTLQNILNKRFVLKKGGTIQWFGDPYRAQIDLSAVYKTKTSLYDIMYEKRDEYKRRVPVNVVMHMTHTLLDPFIEFDIEVPTVSQEVRSQVETAINTEQELNRQVFAVIVLNKFLSPPNGVQTAQTTGGGVTASTTSEMLSNQVSNWLSRISDDFDVGFNYRPGDQVTENEIEVALSTQLFNNRVAINTNVGYKYGETNYTQNPNALIGDFEVEYKITEEGKLRLKVFNVSNDQDLINLNQAPTTQGVGVFYQEDFDSLSELLCKIGNLFRSKKNKKGCEKFLR